MLRQTERFALSLPAQLSAAGYRHTVQTEDLSRSGMFVHTPSPLPVGAQVSVTIAPEGRALSTVAHVAHASDTGMGLAFRAPVEPADHLFAIAIERLLRAHRTRVLDPQLRVLLAEPDPRALAAHAEGLRAAGLLVTCATSALDARLAASRELPDVVVVAHALAMAREPALASVPVIVMSPDPADIDHAFGHGAADFVIQPVAIPELVARVRRHARARAAAADAAILRGSLSSLGLAAVLSMLEQEAGSGRLEVTGTQGGWLELSRGVITGAGTTLGHAGLPAVLAILDERDGSYTLWPGSSASADLALPVRLALLEHARICDEVHRRSSRPDLARAARPAARPHAVA